MTRDAAVRRVWAVVPAAGRGERFTSVASTLTTSPPKQYTQLHGATVLEWSLRALLAEPRIEGIVVVLAADDARWPGISARLDSGKLRTAVGGASRQESVLSGIAALAPRAHAEDWVLVHDAARPCLGGADLSALLDALSGGAAGAMLAAPVVDTVKRERGGAVETVDRSGLWRALTPQVFGVSMLKRALEEAARSGIAVTDEAQAMERMGFSPTLVRGSPFNIKLTRAEDLPLAAAILKMAQE